MVKVIVRIAIPYLCRTLSSSPWMMQRMPLAWHLCSKVKITHWGMPSDMPSWRSEDCHITHCGPCTPTVTQCTLLILAREIKMGCNNIVFCRAVHHDIVRLKFRGRVFCDLVQSWGIVLWIHCPPSIREQDQSQNTDQRWFYYRSQLHSSPLLHPFLNHHHPSSIIITIPLVLTSLPPSQVCQPLRCWRKDWRIYILSVTMSSKHFM